MPPSSLPHDHRPTPPLPQGLTEQGIGIHRNTSADVRSKRRVDLNKQAAEAEASQQATRAALQQQEAVAQMAKQNPNCKVSL